MNKLRRRLCMFLCAFVLCTSVIVAVAACKEDCKKCTNSVTKETWEACDDELEEAKKLPNVTCK